VSIRREEESGLSSWGGLGGGKKGEDPKVSEPFGGKSV